MDCRVAAVQDLINCGLTGVLLYLTIRAAWRMSVCNQMLKSIGWLEMKWWDDPSIQHALICQIVTLGLFRIRERNQAKGGGFFFVFFFQRRGDEQFFPGVI